MKEADGVLSQCGEYSTNRKVYIDVSFHHQSPMMWHEEMINALSPFHTFVVSVGMKITSISRDCFEVQVIVFGRTESSPLAEDGTDKTKEFKASNLK